MKKELELKLVKEFPIIFKDYGGDMRKTCMAWGISVNDGWFDLIRNLCKEINNIIKGTDLKVIADQVKEKFGTLRFYYHIDFNSSKCKEIEKISNEISIIINNYEEKSAKICEVCGKQGKLIGENWLTTLCEECKEKRDK